MSAINEPDQANSDLRLRPPLSPEARRALEEAEQRRRQGDAAAEQRPAEHGGRAGPEPTRYGDWEKSGIVSDF